jgi:hypothetical protein
MAQGFNNSFDKAFNPGMSIGASAAMKTIEDKIKSNEDARKSGAVIDSLEARIIQSSKDKTPEELEGFSKSFDALRKAKLTSTETLAIAKAIMPDMFGKEQGSTQIFVQGNDGAPVLTGEVPKNSKIFKKNLSTEEIGDRITATQDAKYDSTKEVAARAFSLRNELQAIPEIKEFQTVKNQVLSMDALLNNVKLGDGKSALALDQGLITMFNKITDPTSVVRESEYDRTPKNLSLVNRFNGALQKLEKGGAGLTQDDRESLVFGAKIIADSRGNEYNRVISNYENLANEFGVKPELVTSGYGKFGGFISKSFSSEEEARKSGKKSGDRVTINGQSGTLD